MLTFLRVVALNGPPYGNTTVFPVARGSIPA